jgi:hypothetical protein
VRPVPLGLGENAVQFVLLVVVNAFVGAMVGLERSILPAMATQEFHLAARTAMLSFIVVFGLAKAFTNYGALRIGVVILAGAFEGFAIGAVLLGAGTAMVYSRRSAMWHIPRGVRRPSASTDSGAISATPLKRGVISGE